MGINWSNSGDKFVELDHAPPHGVVDVKVSRTLRSLDDLKRAIRDGIAKAVGHLRDWARLRPDGYDIHPKAEFWLEDLVIYMPGKPVLDERLAKSLPPRLKLSGRDPKTAGMDGVARVGLEGNAVHVEFKGQLDLGEFMTRNPAFREAVERFMDVLRG